jgi:hypothetical protein
MSTCNIHTDLPAWADTGGWRPRPALATLLEQVQYALRESFANFVTGWTFMSFDNIVGRTTIFAIPVDFMTPDGYQLLDRIVIRTVLPEEMDDWDEATLVQVNTLASTGALVIDPHVAWAAYYHVNGMVYVEPPEGSGNDERDDPSCWTMADFQPVAEMLNQSGFFSNAGASGLTTEYPWEDGAVTWVNGGVTCLVTFQADVRHPHLGNGLFFKLELPESFDQDVLIELVNRLNVLDLTGADVPPFFGAWCSKIDTGRIAYVGFLPNITYWPGSVGQIASWLKLRSTKARAAIGNYLHAGANAGVARLMRLSEDREAPEPEAPLNRRTS